MSGEDEEGVWSRVGDVEVESVLRLAAFAAVLVLLVLHVARYIFLDAVALVLVAALVLLTYVDYAREAVAGYLALDLGGEVERLRRSMPDAIEGSVGGGGGSSVERQDVFFHVERGEPGVALASLQRELERRLKRVAEGTGSVSRGSSAVELYQVLEFGGGFGELDDAPDDLDEVVDWADDLLDVLTRGVSEGASEEDARELAELGLACLDYLDEVVDGLEN